MPQPTTPDNARTLFRLDNETLAFRFTATVSDRRGIRFERLTEPARLELWLDANRLPTGTMTETQLASAVTLREAIHRAGCAVADGHGIGRSDVALLNATTARGTARRQLRSGVARWAASRDHPIDDALAIIAADAIAALGGERRDRVKACAWESCGGLFVDTSRGANRRWCSMNTCGNRAKKAALHASS